MIAVLTALEALLKIFSYGVKHSPPKYKLVLIKAVTESVKELIWQLSKPNVESRFREFQARVEEAVEDLALSIESAVLTPEVAAEVTEFVVKMDTLVDLLDKLLPANSFNAKNEDEEH